MRKAERRWRQEIMPNDNRQMGVTHQRAILYELKLIKELLIKIQEKL